MAQQFWRKLYRRLKSDTVRYVRGVGWIVVATTALGYGISYLDRLASRHNTAWDNLRAAISWIESGGHWGNAGQIEAIETLTRDCSRWWRGTVFQPAFGLIYDDCVDLNSMALSRMELGSLQAAGANFSRGDLSCANLARANLRNAQLQGTSFRGSNLAGIDLRGAILASERPEDDADFRLANISQAQFDSATVVKPEQLKCACVDFRQAANGDLERDIDEANIRSHEIRAAMRKLQRCPENKCDPATMKNWKCSE